MRRIKLIICYFIITISFLYTTTNASYEPYIYIKDAIKYKNSDEVIVQVYMENSDKKIVTLGLDLEYDTEKLEYVSSKPGKDLKASIQLAENMIEENRVAIGAVSISGFKNNGIYYEVVFKVKDSSQDIPIKLKVREATDSKGNDVKISQKDGIIKISSDENNEVIDKSPENQKIDEFEKNDIKEFETLEEILTNNGNIEISDNDNLIYETESNDIIEVLDDGVIIPNKDGRTNVRIKLNGENIGNVEVEVKDGNVLKVSGNENKLDFIASATTEENIKNSNNTIKTENKNGSENTKLENDNEKNTKEIKIENIKNKVFSTIFIFIFIIIILFIIFFIIKKKRGGRK